MAPSDEEVRKAREAAKNMTSEQLQRIAEAGGTRISSPENIERFRASYSDPSQQFITQFMDSNDKSPEKPQTEISTVGDTQFATVLRAELVDNSQKRGIYLFGFFCSIGFLFLTFFSWLPILDEAIDIPLRLLILVAIFVIGYGAAPSKNLRVAHFVEDTVFCVNCRNLCRGSRIQIDIRNVGNIYEVKGTRHSAVPTSISGTSNIVGFTGDGSVGYGISNVDASINIPVSEYYEELRQATSFTIICPSCNHSEVSKSSVSVVKNINPETNEVSFVPNPPSRNRTDYRISSSIPLSRLKAIKKSDGGIEIVDDLDQERTLGAAIRIAEGLPHNWIFTDLWRYSTIVYESFQENEFPR